MKKIFFTIILLSFAFLAFGQEEYISDNGKKVIIYNTLPENIFNIEIPLSEVANQLSALSEKGLPNCTISAWVDGAKLQMSITIDDDDFLDTIYFNGFISTLPPLLYMNRIYKCFLSMSNESSSNLMIMYEMRTIFNYKTSRGMIQFQGDVQYSHSFLISPFFIMTEGYEAKYPFSASKDIFIQLDRPYFGGTHKASYLVYYIFKDDDQISTYPKLGNLSFSE